MASRVKLYRSSDAGAPVLSGQAGALVALIDAIIAGYNSKTITITRSGSVATATCTAHGFNPDGLQVLRVASADQTEYNGDFPIYNVTANTFQFTVTGTPATPATGTITAKISPADVWVKEFTGTNLGVYRTSDATSGSTREYYRFDDTTTTYASFKGYEAMSDVNSGTDPVTVRYIHKSSTADATARPWVVAVDDRYIHIFTAFHASYAGYAMYGFGDILSEVASDPYCGFTFGGDATGPASTDVTGSMWMCLVHELLANSTTYIKAAGRMTRAGAGVVKDAAAWLTQELLARPPTQSTVHVPGATNATTGAPFPQSSPVDGSARAVRLQVWEAQGAANPLNVGQRGSVPGLFVPLAYRPVAALGTYGSQAAGTSGHKMLAINLGQNSGLAVSGQVHLDITGPWR